MLNKFLSIFKSDDGVKNLIWGMFPQSDVRQNTRIGSSSHIASYFVSEHGLYIDINPPIGLSSMTERVSREFAAADGGNGHRYVQVFGETLDMIRLGLINCIHRVNIKVDTNDQIPPLLSPRYESDAGWDIVVSNDVICEPGQYVDVPSNLFMEMPNDIYGIVQARSSTSKKKMVVLPGVIDPSYRGRVYAMVLNLSSEQITIKKGDRIAQMLFMSRVPHLRVVQTTDALNNSERGEKGFGSTGF